VARAFALIVFRCRLGVDGRLRACDVLEMAPYGLTEAAIEALKTRRYRLALLAGHPIDVSYLLMVQMRPRGMELSSERRMQWVRMRTVKGARPSSKQGRRSWLLVLHPAVE